MGTRRRSVSRSVRTLTRFFPMRKVRDTGRIVSSGISLGSPWALTPRGRWFRGSSMERSLPRQGRDSSGCGWWTSHSRHLTASFNSRADVARQVTEASSSQPQPSRTISPEKISQHFRTTSTACRLHGTLRRLRRTGEPSARTRWPRTLDLAGPRQSQPVVPEDDGSSFGYRPERSRSRVKESGQYRSPSAGWRSELVGSEFAQSRRKLIEGVSTRAVYSQIGRSAIC